MLPIFRRSCLLSNSRRSSAATIHKIPFSSQPQLTLWHSRDARSLRCLWTLEELGIKDYKLVTMPFPPRVFHKEFLQVNALGTIPFLTDGKNSMTESCGICQYLVDKFEPNSLSLEKSHPDYAAFLNWMYHADATLTFPQAIVLRYSLMEPGRCDIAARDYAKWFLARLRLLDSTLMDGRGYLVGGKFTIADICIGYALYLSQTFALKVDGALITDKYKPQTAAYLRRLLERPAFQRSLEIQMSSLQDFEKKTHSP